MSSALAWQLRRIRPRLSPVARILRANSSVAAQPQQGVAAQQHSNAARTTASHIVANLGTPLDLEDYALTFAGQSAAVAAQVVRPLAVVKVGGEVITKDIANLTASLRFLQDSGLQPVVIHGGGPQLNDELAKAGVKPEYIGGHRVTDAATMKVAQRVFEAANAELSAALRAAGMDAAPILGGVFTAEVHDARLGLVGEIRGVCADAVNAALAAGRVPVLTSLGASAAAATLGQRLNINADVAARELAIALRPQRVVFISAGGGWKEAGAVVAEVNMAADYDTWVKRDYTGRQGTLLKLKEMKAIVDNLPPSASVTISSAAALAAQLLPHRGPGSQIRRGVRLLSFSSAGAVDGVRLRALLTAAGHSVAQQHALLDAPGAAHAIERVIVCEDYSAAAIVVRLPQPAAGASVPLAGASVPPAPLPLLHTLALTPLAYAEGSEAALWRALEEAFPAGLAWFAPPPPLSLADAASAVKAEGPAAIPRCFPPLSSRRSQVHAQAGVVLLSSASAPLSSLGEGPSVFVRGAAAASGSLDLAGVAAAVGAYVRGSATTSASASATAVAAPAPAAAGLKASGRPLRVGLLGARGYVGRELVRLLAGHPDLLVTCASSRALVGQDVLAALGVQDAESAVTPGLRMCDFGPEALRRGDAPTVDVWVLALPNGLCRDHAIAIEVAAAAQGVAAPLLIDLSADMRFDASGAWVYGMPESPGARAALRTARRIANPGCYATGAQMALLPLLPRYCEGGGVTSSGAAAGAAVPSWMSLQPSQKPHIFGISGYSGAGTGPSDKNDPARLRDNLLPYALAGHIHEREVGHRCGVPVAFMPHVAPFFQGISLTVTAHLQGGGGAGAGSAEAEAEVRERFAAFYAGEPLVRVLPAGATPDVRTHGSQAHGVTLGGFTCDRATGRVALVSCLDNLLKGAATQALQNINLALGLPELAGIPVGVPPV